MERLPYSVKPEDYVSAPPPPPIHRIEPPRDQPTRVPRSESLLRMDQVELRLGMKKSKIYALAKEDPLLRPVRISARCVAWPESRIDAFIAKVIAQADDLAEQAGRL